MATALLGSVVGLGAAKAVTSHFSVMVEHTSQVYKKKKKINHFSLTY